MSAPVSDRAGVRQVVRTLRQHGWVLDGVDDGGDELVPVRTEAEVLDAVFAVDCSHLFVVSPSGQEHGWVFFVLGNEPEEVVADYTSNLTPLDTLTEGWY